MPLSIVFPPHGSASSPAVDIVAVHGLGGDAFATWTHPKSKAFWPRDFLPEQIPDARIMTFGYNADAAFGQSTAEVLDHAKGLLVSLVDKREEREALLQARLEPRYRSIQEQTLGIIFLGTPHRGSSKAAYGQVLATVAQLMSRRPPPHLLTALQTNADSLLRLTTDFRFQLPGYEVYSFYEQRPMKGFTTLIVEKHSALLEIDHEEQIPVDSDHSAMCKFETDDDDTFEKVYKRVRRMRNNARRIANERSASHREGVTLGRRIESTDFAIVEALSPSDGGKNNRPKPNPSKVRSWEDHSGSFKVEGQFLGVSDGKIHLHKVNGVKIGVPIARMSPEDLDYIERITNTKLKRTSTEGVGGKRAALDTYNAVEVRPWI